MRTELNAMIPPPENIFTHFTHHYNPYTHSKEPYTHSILISKSPMHTQRARYTLKRAPTSPIYSKSPCKEPSIHSMQPYTQNSGERALQSQTFVCHCNSIPPHPHPHHHPWQVMQTQVCRVSQLVACLVSFYFSRQILRPCSSHGRHRCVGCDNYWCVYFHCIFIF